MYKLYNNYLNCLFFCLYFDCSKFVALILVSINRAKVIYSLGMLLHCL